MSIGKGAREFPPPKSIEWEGEIMKVSLEKHLIISGQNPEEKNQAGQPLFQPGDIIQVMPPDRYCKEGWTAEILSISQGFCKYRLLETGEIFHVTQLMLVQSPPKKE